MYKGDSIMGKKGNRAMRKNITQAVNQALDVKFKGVLEDISYRIESLYAKSQNDIMGFVSKVSARDLNLATHALDGYLIEDNKPSAGSIQWTDCNIVYKGTNYAIQNGNTANKYVYWTLAQADKTLFLNSNTKPTLTEDDVLVFVNDGGKHSTIMDKYKHGAAMLDGSVGSTEIKSGSIAKVNLAAGAVDSTILASGAVASGNIAAGAVDATALGSGAVTNVKIASGAVASGNIAAGAVGTTALATGAVTSTVLAANAVTNGKIATGAITGTELAANAVGATAIAANAVTSGKIATGAVTSTTLATGAVTSTAIASGAVGSGALATGAVTATAIADGTITGAKIGSGTVTGSNIQNGSITGTQIGAGTIATDKLNTALHLIF